MARQVLFRIVAIAFAAGAGYHAAASVYPAFHVAGSPARHAAFAVLYALCAYFLLKRPWWFVAAFAAVAVHAVSIHGTRAWVLLQEEQRYDWLSIAVVFLMPCILIFLVMDQIVRRRGSQSRDSLASQQSHPE